MPTTSHSAEELIAKLAALGAAVGLGQLLASGEKLSARLVTGRVLTSAGLGAAASIPLGWMPDLPTAAMYGLACGLVTLGVAGIEKLTHRFFEARKP